MERDYGIWIKTYEYRLRPEVVESYFYAYRITGDKKYQDWAWDAFQGIVKATEAAYGYSAIGSVQLGGKTNLLDECESFWGAETLKYLYLTFASEDLISLDDWVFNTEAHPFKIER